MSVKILLHEVDWHEMEPDGSVARDYKEVYPSNTFEVEERHHAGAVRGLEINVRCAKDTLKFTSNSVEKLMRCLVENEYSRRMLSKLLEEEQKLPERERKILERERKILEIKHWRTTA